jgi:purine-binding chemotaxis protein CheW
MMKRKKAQPRKVTSRAPRKRAVERAASREEISLSPTEGNTDGLSAALAPLAAPEDPSLPARRSLREAIAARDGQSDTLVFRVGGERFAIDLGAVEEAIELPSVHHLPEMPDHLLGVFELRERLVPIYSPVRVLRVALTEEAAAVLVLRSHDKRLGLAVDDVDDVLTIDGAAVRRAPIPDNEDNVLLGVIRRGADLLALVDAESLALACLADQPTEAV